MLTANERIAKLEEQVHQLRAELMVAGALPVFVAQSILDEMVDRRLLPSEVRAAIFDSIKRGLRTIEAGSEEIGRGAMHAVPRYRVFSEVTHQERARKETLRVRMPIPDSDQ